MSVSSFNRKRLRLTFILANSNAAFDGPAGDANVLTVEGLRTIATVKSSGASTYATASVQVFGMRQKDMNALTMLQWKDDAAMRNTLVIEANDGSGWINVFSGSIYYGGPDYSDPANPMLRAEANALFVEALIPAVPSSYTGPTDAATIVSNIAAAMGKVFENNGVDVVLQSPYLPGTLVQQLAAIRIAANIDIYTDADVIAITPHGQPRRTPEVRITPQSGLVGYPTIDVAGVQLQTLFNPAYRFGGPVIIEGADVPRANGRWFIYSLDHYLESERPGGSWFSQLGVSELANTVIQ